ncbi:GNAT family N-acetyltransferase [Phenylobacterium sp.]|uniref:GNAT family N-acetyltransferase n=1 Tax=Phenylobacterium sp. TaxID=1871053 RepID=UPI00273156E4|nr:GNAT family N-acetyltransferase [Phenylobacterium sp.]MDP1618092.1 GNAT family N-acetyltransferase [Phenylobacterium sp.]MDP1988707.1 GNAT family N-acetyltransferase [Phenylobacterium sp.]
MSADLRPGLLEERVGALYRTDADGRLLGSNEWDSRPAPRFHLMRTAAGPILRGRADLPADLLQRLQALSLQEPAEQAFTRLPAQYDQYLAALAEQAPVEKIWAGPAYVLPPQQTPGLEVVNIDAGARDVLRGRFDDWLEDVAHRWPFVAVIAEGAAAAICASVRISPTVHCAGVETHPGFRRRGYALAAVTGWASAVRACGATPFYSTSWDNLASQRVARRLGAQLVGVDFHVT